MRNFQGLCEDWVQHRLRAGVRSITAYNYRGSLAVFCRFLGNRPASELSLDDDRLRAVSIHARSKLLEASERDLVPAVPRLA